jgi:hypothetical protein
VAEEGQLPSDIPPVRGDKQSVEAIFVSTANCWQAPHPTCWTTGPR